MKTGIEIELHSEDLKKGIQDLTYSEGDGDYILIPESDYGFAEIHRVYDDLLIFMIPTYGGTPSFYKCFSLQMVDSLIKELREIC
jgi:hypothetical protein